MTLSQPENSTKMTPHMIAATMHAPMYPPKPDWGMIRAAGAMNTKLPTMTIGILAPMGPRPKLWMNVHMPLTNSADATSRAVCTASRPTPAEMSRGAGRVWKRMMSACCKPKARR